MTSTKKVYSINWGGKEVTLETGWMAKQADGAVLVSCEGTQVLVTVVSSKELKDGQDFFPLTVDYNERFYAAGKFLGGFNKRETKPTTAETLNARLIDRPLRPLFPEGYMYETFVQATVHSYSAKGDPEVLSGLGAAAALAISDIPFNGPLATCKVGRIDGQLVLNPTLEDWKKSDLELAVSASKEAIMMVEGEAHEVSEKDMLEALQFAHQNIREFCAVIERMVRECGRPKRAYTSVIANETLVNKVRASYQNEARKALSINEKHKRQAAVGEIVATVKAAIAQDPAAFGLTEKDSAGKEAFKGVDSLLYKMMREDILNESRRIGGRGLQEVRQITTEVDVLKVPHGSALFTRGETQVLGTATLGGEAGEQMVDRITGLEYVPFYLHYSFPPFSVGEARGVRGVGRRELGHGNLAERAIKMVLPSADDFSYTMRVYCEVLESNGSSSMGSVCAGCMALLDAGVPLKAPVSGIAMGLIKEGERYKILTDILGDEDHLGDMDFKVAGTSKGITAIQMDIKITGINERIFSEALEDARVARLKILKEMEKTITAPRNIFKEGVPRMKSTKIAQDAIGALIGPGGKNIKALQERYKVSIEVAEDGKVKVISADEKNIDEALKLIEMQMNGPRQGGDYLGIAVSVKEYGAFVEIAPGVSGLLHISEFTDSRVQDPSEYVQEGDEVMVRVMEIDRFGKIKFSAKAVKPMQKRQ